MITSARLFNCARCYKQVIICSYCDRGNIYCGSICSRHARVEKHCIANQRYQKSIKGRQKHAKRQRHYRERRKIKMTKVTDQSSPDLPADDLLPHEPSEHTTPQAESLHCDFCGKVVLPFLRNGYLRHHVEDQLRCFSSWPLGP
jgi:hypothetical protein